MDLQRRSIFERGFELAACFGNFSTKAGAMFGPSPRLKQREVATP
jgi:hypothetical protein